MAKRKNQKPAALTPGQLASQEVSAYLRNRYASITPSEFLQLINDQIGRAVLTIYDHVEGTDNGQHVYPHRLPKATWKRLMVKLAEASEIVRTSGVTINGDGRLGAARADSAFQQFLVAQCVKD